MTFSEADVRSYLRLHRSPLAGISEDDNWWTIGQLQVSKKHATFRSGFGHPILASTRFVLEAFDADGVKGSAIVLLSGGKPPAYFAGWVPVTGEQEAMHWVDQLNHALRSVSGGVAATTRVDMDAVEAVVYEIGSANAPDSPFGQQAVRLTRDGRVDYRRSQGAGCEQREGTVGAQRVAAVIDALRRTTFPLPPQTRFVPGGSIARIIVLPTGDQIDIDYFEALRMEGYSHVVREMTRLCNGLRTDDANVLHEWGFAQTAPE